MNKEQLNALLYDKLNLKSEPIKEIISNVDNTGCSILLMEQGILTIFKFKGKYGIDVNERDYILSKYAKYIGN